MNTTTKPAAPTEDEILAALLRETVRDTDTGGGNTRADWSPASRIDVAERIARTRGWDGTKGFQHTTGSAPTRAAVIGKHVSIKAVQDTLDRLYSEGRAHAFYGRHRLIATKYGVNPNSIYYLSTEALELLFAERRRGWRDHIEREALAAAEKRVLAEHADEVSDYYTGNLAELLLTEPDWQAMLADEDPQD